MKRLILDIIKKYFPVVFVKYRYFKVFGKKLNLKNPTGFNEKNTLAYSILARSENCAMCRQMA